MITKKVGCSAACAYDRAAAFRLNSARGGRTVPTLSNTRLRVNVPNSRQRALMREFGLDTAALTEEESQKRRDGLTAHEAKVIRMRCGIDTSDNHTLEEVGRRLDLSRERVR